MSCGNRIATACRCRSVHNAANHHEVTRVQLRFDCYMVKAKPENTVLGGNMDLQKVLVVDNDPSVLLDLVGFLGDVSYEVWTAQDGPRCLDILRKEEIDLAIIEILAGDLGGIALLKLVKAEQIQTVMLGMASLGTLELGEAAIRAGAVSLFDKPIKRHVFLTKIQKYMPPQDMWKDWFESFLDDNYGNSHLNFADVMHYFRFSKSHGYALFKKHLGKTFRAALREIRVREAIVLLGEIPHVPIYEIALSTRQ